LYITPNKPPRTAAAKTGITYIFIQTNVHLFYKEKSFSQFMFWGLAFCLVLPGGFYFWCFLVFMECTGAPKNKKGFRKLYNCFLNP